MDKSNSSEQNPLFPSGIWEGFYLYTSGSDADRHAMNFRLDFRDGKITGSGSDDVGAFSWQGTYDTASLAVSLIKSYPTHSVFYQGMADTNGIYGTWHMVFMRGGFHIWPKENGEEAIEEEVTVEEKELVKG